MIGNPKFSTIRRDHPRLYNIRFAFAGDKLFQHMFESFTVWTVVGDNNIVDRVYSVLFFLLSLPAISREHVRSICVRVLNHAREVKRLCGKPLLLIFARLTVPVCYAYLFFFLFSIKITRQHVFYFIRLSEIPADRPI